MSSIDINVLHTKRKLVRKTNIIKKLSIRKFLNEKKKLVECIWYALTQKT